MNLHACVSKLVDEYENFNIMSKNATTEIARILIEEFEQTLS